MPRVHLAGALAAATPIKPRRPDRPGRHRRPVADAFPSPRDDPHTSPHGPTILRRDGGDAMAACAAGSDGPAALATPRPLSPPPGPLHAQRSLPRARPRRSPPSAKQAMQVGVGRVAATRPAARPPRRRLPWPHAPRNSRWTVVGGPVAVGLGALAPVGGDGNADSAAARRVARPRSARAARPAPDAARLAAGDPVGIFGSGVCGWGGARAGGGARRARPRRPQRSPSSILRPATAASPAGSTTRSSRP